MALEPETYELPYDTRIAGGLYLGSTVKLEGLIPEQSTWFCVKIANGQHERAKALKLRVALVDLSYMDIRISNCFENRPIKKMFLNRNRRFIIKIQVTHDDYKMFLNDQLLDQFPHRCLPPKDATFLEMEGDVILEKYTPPLQLPARS